MNQINEKYENIVVIGDFNIDLLNSNFKKENHFSDFSNTFNLDIPNLL